MLSSKMLAIGITKGVSVNPKHVIGLVIHYSNSEDMKDFFVFVDIRESTNQPEK